MTDEMTCTIRRAANGDEITACAALYERVIAAAFSWRPAGYHSAAEFLGFAAQEEVWLAEQDGAVVGLLSVFCRSIGRAISSMRCMSIRAHKGAASAGRLLKPSPPARPGRWR